MSSGGRRNHLLWAGPLISIAGVLSYFTIFARWPLTRDLPWANLAIIAAGITASVYGLLGARSRGGWRTGAGVASLAVSLAAGGLLSWYCFFLSYELPDSAGALAVGARVPRAVLTDQRGDEVDLGSAASERLVLVFYRGHW